ncbi:MAG TPA: CoA-binding protein [Saprospiraceae bacterium]|nr:CoA-binding protein [Saprospiraceae bacterium]HMP14196.1 CoA-binding protein [Saprospiraceae bacterium]
MNTVYLPLIKSFLELQNIAILGYSSKGNQPANLIYNKLKNNGYQVFAVNPKADAVKDVPCYPNVQSIPQPVEAAVLCTPAHASEQAVRDCAARGIQQIWIHTGMGPGSFDLKALAIAKQLGVKIIPGGCPMMYVRPDWFHKCLGWLTKLPE